MSIEEAKRRARERAALQQTRALYRKADEAYARFSCPASGECCQLAARGHQPYLWPTEWWLLKAAVPTPPPRRPDGACPFLDESGKRCSVYAARPLGCRTYFCERRIGPSREPAAVLAELLERLAALNQELSPETDGPTPLLTWLEGDK